jgi:hypothetical protein
MQEQGIWMVMHQFGSDRYNRSEFFTPQQALDKGLDLTAHIETDGLGNIGVCGGHRTVARQRGGKVSGVVMLELVHQDLLLARRRRRSANFSF